MEYGTESANAAEENHLNHQSKRHLAIIECEDAAKWEGYTETLWKEALHEAGDCWTLYKACSGELPTPAEAATYDAIVIGGSHYSAYEEHGWIKKMLKLLPQYVAQRARIYACCFGSLILARALGGSVGANPDGNFVLTLEQIQPTPELQQLTELHQLVQQALKDACTLNSSCCSNSDSIATAVQSAAAAADECQSSSPASAASVDGVVDSLHEMQLACSTGCFRLIESHGDQVLTLPPGAIRLATSPTAVNELWCYGPNVLASQFHLEFDEPLVLEKIWKTLRDVGRLDEQQAAESRRVLEAGGQQNAGMLQVIKYFLKHGLPAVEARDITDSNNNFESSGGDSSGSSGDEGADATSSISATGIKISSGTSSSSARGNPGVVQGRVAGETMQGQRQQQQQLGNTAAAAAAGAIGDLSSAAAAETASATNSSAYPPVMTAAADIPQLDVHSRSDTTGVAAPVAVPASDSKTLHQQERTGSDQLGSQHRAHSVDSSNGTGGLAPVVTQLRHGALAADSSAALISGDSSPTALSEHSVATAASTSSTIPFSQISYQRRQQQRGEGLVESSQQLVDAAAAAFDTRMECYDLDLKTLQQLNEAAADQYSSTAEIATALCQFVTDLETRQAAAREALAVLPQLDRQLKLLENAVGQLDRRSKDLEGRLGLGKSSAYEYLASTFGKAGSSVSAAAYYAAGGGTCLGAPPAPEQ